MIISSLEFLVFHIILKNMKLMLKISDKYVKNCLPVNLYKHLQKIFEKSEKTIDCLRRKWYNNLVKNRKP
jgi:hypothetical protein